MSNPMPHQRRKGEPGKLRALIVTTLVVLGATLLATTAEAQDTSDKRILVFAASSLTDALGAIAARYEKTSDDRIVLSFSSSSTLARQIESGAPADIYVSADVQWMDYLQDHELIRADTREDIVGNRLVLIAPRESQLKPTEIRPDFPLARWLGDGRLAMGNPEYVPAGIYGKQALKSLKVWNSVRREVARAEDVRAALALVALGEAPLGIVYTTDALAENDVKIIGTFPESTHPPIVYPAALTVAGEGASAQPFFEYIISDQAQAIFQRYGFVALD